MFDRADIVQAIGTAPSNRQRAAIMLTLPDSAILEMAELLRRGCERAGYPDGAEYVDARLAILRAGRDLSGHLAPETEIEFIHLRAAMARFAAGA